MVLATLLAGAAQAGPAGFGPGEQTTYEVRLLGVTAGQAQVTVGWPTTRDGQSVWPLVCVGRTTSVASVMRLNDRFVSFWAPEEQRSIGADFFVDEGGARRREAYRYDFAQARVFAHKQREGEGPYDVDYDADQEMGDLTSAAFTLRGRALKVGEAHEMTIFTGHKTYRLHATVEALEDVTTPLGTEPAYRVSITTDFTGGAATQGNVTVHFTADARQLPVRAEAQFLVGHLVVEAVKYEAGHSTKGSAP
jgi:hypothetical protein